MIAIGSVEELKTFRDDVNSGNNYEGKYVYLTGNITLDSSESWEPIGLYLMENSIPDAETNKPFSGIFDGKGYEVNGIYINTTNKVQGLFGLVESGKITNLGIGENNSITGGIATAGLVGYLYNGAEISNCYNKSNISGNNSYLGGIVGISVKNCKIINTHNNGIINGSRTIGGIIGRCQNVANIENCYNSGTITGDYDVGGIVGSTTSEDNIKQCYNTGTIETTGKNDSNNANVGGIIGLNEANIQDCYNTGIIIGVYNNIGGITGLNRGKIENCYNIGQLRGSVENKGGITGNNNLFEGTTVTYVGEIYNSYTLSEVTDKIAGINNSTIGSECSLKNSAELKQIYTILGESFKQDENNINQGYPVLAWQ